MPRPKLSTNPQLKALRWRLLLSSLSVMGCTLTVFGIVIYQVVAHNLEQKSDRQLRILADAAAHSLPDVLASQRGAIVQTTPRTIDSDDDLDIPWQDLRQDQQGIEWFNAKGQLLGQAGRSFPTHALKPLNGNAQDNSDTGTDMIFDRDSKTHQITLPVYKTDSKTANSRITNSQTANSRIPDSAVDLDTDQLQGYVRVSESTGEMAEELSRLRSGLAWGSFGALVLSALGGFWLTQQSLQPIDRSIRQLKQFTADASHELRNPLTAIRASVELMQSHRERFHAADVQQIEAIGSAAVQMGQLVNDLLWLARSDQATIEESPAVLIPLNDLLEEVLDQYMAQAEQKQITLLSDFQAEPIVLGNPWQLKRLFGNLVTNGLRYTPSGGKVTIASSLQDQWAIVQVRDTGIGIAADHLPLVFDRFWQADSARAQQGSSGLGLAIVQAIVQQHQGQISVQSELDKGSCFQVNLPRIDR